MAALEGDDCVEAVATRTAVEPGVPSAVDGQLSNNGETETESVPARACSVVWTPEPFERPGPYIGCHSGTFVDDVQLDRIGAWCDADGDCRSVRHSFEGVAAQVVE